VESKLKKKVTEMSCFNKEDQKKLMEAYSWKVKNIDLKIVEQPKDLVSQFSNGLSDIIIDSHSIVELDASTLLATKSGATRSNWETKIDDEFWNWSQSGYQRRSIVYDLYIMSLYLLFQITLRVDKYNYI
jgi:hypothetical protein